MLFNFLRDSHCTHPAFCAFTIVSFSTSFPSPTPSRVWCLLRARALFCSHCHATTSFKQRCLAFSQCMSEWGPHSVHSCCVYRGSRRHFLCGLPLYPATLPSSHCYWSAHLAMSVKETPAGSASGSHCLSLYPVSKPFMYWRELHLSRLKTQFFPWL